MNRFGDIEAAQLAGIWDCDGHIGLARRATAAGRMDYRVVVQIGQTGRALLDWIVAVLGCGRVYRHGQRPMFHLRLPERIAAAFLKRLAPYLVLKKRQAELVAEFAASKVWNGRSMPADVIAWRESVWAELRALNRKNAGSAYRPPLRRRLELVEDAG